jgi:hypothetical protein
MLPDPRAGGGTRLDFHLISNHIVERAIISRAPGCRPAVAETAALRPGFAAYRAAPGQPWYAEPFAYEDDPDDDGDDPEDDHGARDGH